MTAGGPRLQRRLATQIRICRRAKELAVDVGFDGFTMDRLAADCGVSRRTLFNYVSGKDEAVLGVAPEIRAESLAAFRAGGPTGLLVPDLAALVREVLTDHAEVTPYDVALGPRVLARNPQLAQKELDKLGEYADLVRSATAERERVATDDLRVTLALELVLWLVRTTFETYAASDGAHSLAAEFDRVVAAAHALGESATAP